MTAAFKGGAVFARLNTSVSPNAYDTIEENANISGLGVTNPLIDVTSHDSSAREYIAGLADGSEITIESNYIQTASNKQLDLMTDVDNGTTSGFRLTMTNASVSPNTVKTFTFNAVCLTYEITPSFDDKHMISFNLKISGAITRA